MLSSASTGRVGVGGDGRTGVAQGLVKIKAVSNSQILPRWFSPQSESVCHLGTHITKARRQRYGHGAKRPT